MKKRLIELCNHLIPIVFRKQLHEPIFIIGCGRSGTTILGTALSKHSNVVYLNERRDLWFSAYEFTDIWSKEAERRKGRALLTAKDYNPKSASKLRRLFQFQLLRKKALLIEKLPINNFRLEFLKSNFPNAKYIYISRNGLEVAKSIEKLAKKGFWFGVNDYKWNQLKTIARHNPNHKILLKLCNDDYSKGLLEWRLSTEYIHNFLEHEGPKNYIEVSYLSLVNNPLNTVNEIIDFIELKKDDKKVNHFVNNISRRSNDLQSQELTDTEKKIGGEFLINSLKS